MTPARNEVAAAMRRLAGSGTWQRGLDVERRGLVYEFSLTTGGETLEARVGGSHDEIYRQVITVSRDRAGALHGLRGVCTCPVGVDCKHVVAACLAAAAALMPALASNQPESSRTTSGDPQIDAWLRLIETASREAGSDPEAYPPEIDDRLYYVLSRAPSGLAVLDPWKVRLLKSRAVGAGPTRYDPGNVKPGQLARFVRPSDERICADLKQLRPGHIGYQPVRNLRSDTLEAALATGRVRLDDVHGPALKQGDPRSGSFIWQEVDDGAQCLVAQEESGNPLAVLPMEPVWYIDVATGETGLFETELPPALATALAAAPSIPAEAAEDVTAALTDRAGSSAPLPQAVTIERIRDIRPVPVLTLAASDASGHDTTYGAGKHERCFPLLDLSFAYGEAQPVPRLLKGASSPAPIRARGSDGLSLIERNVSIEMGMTGTLLAECSEHGFLPAQRAQDAAWIMEAEETDIVFDAVESSNRWRREVAPQSVIDEAAFSLVGEVLPGLAAKGWRIEYDESWDWRLYDGPVEFNAGTESSGIDWFSFSLTVTAGEEQLDMLPVILSVIDILPVNGNGELPGDFDLDAFLEDLVLYPQLDSGARLRLEAGVLAPIVRAFLEVHGLTGFHLGEAGQAARLVEMLEGCGIPWQGDRTLLDLAEKLNALAAHPDAEPPASLTADLRPYQKTGFGWLKALSETGFGGALADDMGLGKTVQALALLAQRHLEEGCDRPSLLVAPTSMVGTWQREAARFAPGLKVLILHGPDRKARFGEIDDHHLIVTTYPLLHRDHETLFARPYELAILDEAQAVKNPASSVSKRIREIDARQRLALTGTPVENNLQELWALFDWLVPGLLGDRRRFVTQIRTPIERDGSVVARKLLATRLRPFLLRRTKEEVASDLPPKTIIDEIVPLEGKQAQLYETLRVAMDARVRKAIKDKGVDKSRITILDALLKLRQACCDPALVKLDAARAVTESAKRARLMALLDELMAEGRKVLVFSQFVEMLKLVEADVTARGWDYTMLTGRTRKRPEAIARFQDGEVPLFLISLKAGGTGLTLTEADTVVLYDPWWNPAVERQAMDRAHRIGQTKPVFVHRLIADGTVEAAIQKMQAKKQALADALFEEGAGGKLTLDEDDLTALFAPIG